MNIHYIGANSAHRKNEMQTIGIYDRKTEGNEAPENDQKEEEEEGEEEKHKTAEKQKNT